MKKKFLENLIKNAYYNTYKFRSTIEKVVINEITDGNILATIYEICDNTVYIGKVIYNSDKPLKYECIEVYDRE